MPKGRGRRDSESDGGTDEQTTVGTFETLRDEGEHFVHVKQYQRAIESFTKVRNVVLIIIRSGDFHIKIDYMLCGTNIHSKSTGRLLVLQC